MKKSPGEGVIRVNTLHSSRSLHCFRQDEISAIPPEGRFTVRLTAGLADAYSLSHRDNLVNFQAWDQSDAKSA